METDLEDETPEDEYLRVNCPRIFDVRNIIDAIANKWSNVVYPYKNQENTNKLYKVFDTLLKTLGGGKCAEFIVGFLDGRLRQVLKAAVAQALTVESLAPVRALLDACKESGANSTDPVVCAVRTNISAQRRRWKSAATARNTLSNQ